MKKIIEIKGCEGGDDAKMFARELSASYVKLIERKHWKYQLTNTDSLIRISVNGKGSDKLVNEAGGHRVQRVPTNERGGRVHTSSVTVAVMDFVTEQAVKYNDNDFRVEWFSGTGKGGQHRNKRQNSCRLIHIPTGIVESRQGRKRQSNYDDAKSAILATLKSHSTSKNTSDANKVRQSQVGSGMRGDKIRTYRFQDNSVVDHLTNKQARCSDVMKGKFDLLWR